MVRAPPRVLPRSLAPSGVLGGGGGSGPGSPLAGLGLCASRGAGPWRSCAGGRGGGGPCAAPPVLAAGGASRAGGCSALFSPSAFPGQATKRVSLALFWSWGAWPPYCSGSCSPAFSGRGLCGVLARSRRLACCLRCLWEPAAGAGGRAVLRPLSRAGGGGTIPSASGGWRPPPPRLAGRWGGWGGGGGGSRRGLPAPPLGGSPRFPTLAPSCRRRTPPRRAPSVGVAGPPRGGGGMRGGPWTAPPGAPSDLNPPSPLPEWAMVMGGSWGAPPPYCSGAPLCAAPRLGPRATPARWCGLARRPRPPREQAAGGAGARCAGPAASPPPPPPRRGPFWGRGGVPSSPRGRRVTPVALKRGGERGGGGWRGRSAAPRPPASSSVGLPSLVSGAPPRSILVTWGWPGGRGHRARPGRPPMGQCGGKGREGGGGIPPPWFAPPPSPGRPLKGQLRLRRPGRRPSAVGRQRAGRERAGGSPGALAAAAVPPQPGCSGLSGGGAGPLFLRPASVRSWA